MPPKSDYWKYFLVQGVLAVCQISGCPKPNVSLGPEAKPGQKKRIRKYMLNCICIVYNITGLINIMFSLREWCSRKPSVEAS